MTTYTVLILEKNSVQITDLVPDTTYVVRVQVAGREANPASRGAEHDFHTSPLGETMTAAPLLPSSTCISNPSPHVLFIYYSRVPDPEQIHAGDGRRLRHHGDPAGGGGRPVPAQKVGNRPQNGL